MNVEAELRKRLEQHGYKLEKIKSFKNYDRITFSTKKAVFSINLRAHLAEVNFETVVDAVVGKRTGKTVG